MINKNDKKLLINISLVIIFSIIVTIGVEIITRNSFYDAFRFIVEHPYRYLYNCCLVMFTASVVLLTKRKVLAYSMVTVLWLFLSITDNLVVKFRGTPFNANDLELISEAVKIVNEYLNAPQIIMLIMTIILIIAGIVWGWKKSGQTSEVIEYKKVLSIIIVCFIIFVGITKFAEDDNLLQVEFNNLGEAYENYGFAYSFTETMVNRGIKMPKDYSEAMVTEIDKNLLCNGNIINSNSDKEKTVYPNIIMVQLEAFFDPELIKDVTYNVDPINNFRKLSERFSSGDIIVSTLGGGTAQTEFQALTGMSLEFFGLGEYPYYTVLQDKSCETINYNLKEEGYSTHAIHNNDGTFYDRNKVFSNLGFDTFTSLEYMKNIETNETGWAKDKILINEVLTALNSTEEKDFVYTITVQGHGGYPTEEILTNKNVVVAGDIDEGQKNSIEYYVNQLYEVDKFIKDLIDEVDKRGEPTVIAFYGDHLPGLSLNKNNVKDGDLYKTPYFIWDNMGLEKQDKDLKIYQLSSEILGRVNIHNGIIMEYHQKMKESEDYLKNLKTLQYDMLYGEGYIKGEENKSYEPTNLKMGILDIKISDVQFDNGIITIKGENFTTYSKVVINEKEYNTTFVDNNTLTVEKKDYFENEKLQVEQVDKYGNMLSIISFN